MKRKAISLALVLLLTCPISFGQTPAPATIDADVLKGIALVEEGDYDGAILTLDNAARRLAVAKNQQQDLSQAYLYLGIAYVGKGHEAAAKAKFREALGQIRDITLSPDRFPPKVINTFEAAKEEVAKAAPAPTEAAKAPQTAEKKKGGSGKVLLIVGGLAAAGGIAAAAGGGGGGSSAPAPTTTTLPPDPRTVFTASGTLCGDDRACENYRVFDIVVSRNGTLDATVTWGNPAIFFAIGLDDENFVTVQRSNRTTNTMSQLSAQVTPQRGSPSSAYHLYVHRGDSEPVSDNFTVTVRHP